MAAQAGQWSDRNLRVLFVLSQEPLFVAGKSSFVDDMIRTCGARNVIEQVASISRASPWPQVSREALVATDPQLIIFAETRSLGQATVPDMLTELRGTPAWREVAAVRAGQVCTINDDLVTIPGPRLIDGLEEICRLVGAARPRLATSQAPATPPAPPGQKGCCGE